jgi:hypothetical protein
MTNGTREQVERELTRRLQELPREAPPQLVLVSDKGGSIELGMLSLLSCDGSECGLSLGQHLMQLGQMIGSGYRQVLVVPGFWGIALTAWSPALVQDIETGEPDFQTARIGIAVTLRDEGDNLMLAASEEDEIGEVDMTVAGNALPLMTAVLLAILAGAS